MKSGKVKLATIIVILTIIIVGGVLAYFMLFKPKKPEEEKPKEPVTLVVISRHPSDILIKARGAFLKSEVAKKYNIVDVRTISLAPGLWKKYIETGQADIGWGGGPTLFDSLYKEGLLAPLTSEEVLKAIKEVPDEILGVPMKRTGKDGKIYWVAAAIASFGFTVNYDRMEDYGLSTPKSWRDLASPELGKVLVKFGEPALGIADPTASTSNTRMYEIILQRYGWVEGWKILTLMAANAEVYSGSSDVRDAVMRGDIAVGITIDFYGYTAKLNNPKCEYIVPKGESIVNGDPIALAKNSKHPIEAQAFIAWVLTEGQKVWLDPDINRLPANPKVFDTPEGKNRSDLYKAYLKTLETKAMEFNDTEALMYEVIMQWYFKATLVDLNKELKETWKELLTLYFEGKITEDKFKKYADALGSLLKFTDPETGKEVLFTKEYATSISDKFFKDPTFKDKLIRAWRDAARAKYKRILNELKTIGS